ncbi:hypothetical protein SFC55_01270 [Niallia taxi]|uniref:hypothetical protein n=1 Tax=Niallia taxi TaxID=2499688 RepID=UPI0039823A85
MNSTAIFFNLDSSIIIVENIQIADTSVTDEINFILTPEDGDIVFLKNDIDWDYGY